jgi:hypothetical protein
VLWDNASQKLVETMLQVTLYALIRFSIVKQPSRSTHALMQYLCRLTKTVKAYTEFDWLTQLAAVGLFVVGFDVVVGLLVVLFLVLVLIFELFIADVLFVGLSLLVVGLLVELLVVEDGFSSFDGFCHALHLASVGHT